MGFVTEIDILQLQYPHFYPIMSQDILLTGHP